MTRTNPNTGKRVLYCPLLLRVMLLAVFLMAAIYFIAAGVGGINDGSQLSVIYLLIAYPFLYLGLRAFWSRIEIDGMNVAVYEIWRTRRFDAGDLVRIDIRPSGPFGNIAAVFVLPDGEIACPRLMMSTRSCDAEEWRRQILDALER